MSVQAPFNAQISQVTTAGGTKSALNLTAGAHLIQLGVGRVMRICVNTAGTAGTFAINDAATTGAAAAANLVWAGSATTAAGTVIDLEFPVSAGLVFTVPTTGVMSISYV